MTDTPKKALSISSIRSIADIGASKKRHYAFLKMFHETFKGRLYAITTRVEPVPELPDVPVYANVTEVPDNEPVDFAFIEVPRERVIGVIKDCASKGVKLAAIFSSGFADAGTEEGRRLQDELARVINEEGNGIRVIGPNGMGLYYPRLGIRWRPSLPIDHGSTGVVAQSGGLCNLLIHGLSAAGMHISTALSIGNAMDVTAIDAFKYFRDDTETRRVVAYLEGIPEGTGREFLQLMKSLESCNKPVILMKGGRTATGSKAARSHTASLVGEYSAWLAATRQSGAILVETFEDVIDVARYVDCYGRTRMKSVCMLTLSGGYGVISSDVLASHGMVVPDFASNQGLESTLQRMMAASGTSAGNPIDVGAFIYEVDKLEGVAFAVLSDPSIDGLIIEVAPIYAAASLRPDVHLEAELPAMLDRVRRRVPKPIVAIVEDLGYEDVKKDIMSRLLKINVPVFSDIGHLARVLRFMNNLKKPEG